MADLKDVIAYFISNYPDSMKDELSNARLTKMVYLADWHSCINQRGQITDISWYFDNYGPFVRDVEVAANDHPDLFIVENVKNRYGSTKKKFALRKTYTPKLTENERKSLDHIIGVTSKLYWNDFIRLVYGTHPIASSERYDSLDLRAKAREYRDLKALKTETSSR
jgi:hypothetical protein